MEARELRINNWVNVTNKLTGFTIDNIITASGLLDLYSNKERSSFTYQPIPLTEEWLLKFGFKNQIIKINCYSIIELDFNSKEYPVYNCFLKQKNSDSTNDSFLMDVKIQYVHQLQNLYFALTNKELTIK